MADLLASGLHGVDGLAVASGPDSSPLQRLLRMLTGPGVFREEPDGRFAVRPPGPTLQSGGPDSVRDWALFAGAPEIWAVWAGLRDSVMTRQSRQQDTALVAAYDFSPFRLVARHRPPTHRRCSQYQKPRCTTQPSCGSRR